MDKKGQNIVPDLSTDYGNQSSSLSADGNTIAIGGISSSLPNYSGHVRVFDWDGSFLD